MFFEKNKNNQKRNRFFFNKWPLPWNNSVKKLFICSYYLKNAIFNNKNINMQRVGVVIYIDHLLFLFYSLLIFNFFIYLFKSWSKNWLNNYSNVILNFGYGCNIFLIVYINSLDTSIFGLNYTCCFLILLSNFGISYAWYGGLPYKS